MDGDKLKLTPAQVQDAGMGALDRIEAAIRRELKIKAVAEAAAPDYPKLAGVRSTLNSLISMIEAERTALTS